MSSIHDDRHRRGRDWPLLVLGMVVALIGLVLATGGAYLASLGGSWYYVLAGIGLVVSGVQLMRGRLSGAWWFAAVFVGTLAWTIWESGLTYWRWIPRLGLVVVLAFFVALLAPRLAGWRSRGLARGLAALMVVLFVGAFALAFVPHGVVQADRGVAAARIGSSAVPAATVMPAQPANAPVATDWPAYGRSNAAQRYSPLTAINRDNVDGLERAWTYRTGDLPERRWGAETTPLKIGDTLYLCSARNVLIALDSVTGEERWRFDPKVPDKAIPYTAACRGVSYYDARVAAGPMAMAANIAAPDDAGSRPPEAGDAAAVEPVARSRHAGPGAHRTCTRRGLTDADGGALEGSARDVRHPAAAAASGADARNRGGLGRALQD